MYNEGNCLRTFLGHTRALKDIAFSPTGTRFLSTGHDRQIKLWDTETGKCIKSFSNGKMAHVVKWFPEEDKGGEGVFLAGMGDKKIIQVGAIQVLDRSPVLVLTSCAAVRHRLW